MTDVYRRARLLVMRPPLAYGGHGFTRAGVLWYCHGCHQSVPGWALTEGLWAPMIGRWCPGLFAALTP